MSHAGNSGISSSVLITPDLDFGSMPASLGPDHLPQTGGSARATQLAWSRRNTSAFSAFAGFRLEQRTTDNHLELPACR
jgi:hypothetical protein